MQTGQFTQGRIDSSDEHAFGAWLQKLERLRPHALDLIRIYLGIGLLVRGALFTSNQQLLQDVIGSSGSWVWPFALAHFVILAHITGGLLLAVGLFTRTAALLQLVPVLGAVFFVHRGEGLFTSGQSLELSVLVLFLLGIFGVVGGGRLSVDFAMNKAEHHDLGGALRAAR